MDRPFQFLNFVANDVHADPSAGDFADLFRRAETGQEDERRQFFFAAIRCFNGGDQALSDGGLADRGVVQTTSVIGDPDHHLRPLLKRLHADRRPFRFARRLSSRRILQPVIDCVPQQVHQRIGQFFQHHLVDLGLASVNLKLDLFVLLRGDGAHDPMQLVRQSREGQQPNPHQAVLRVARQTALSIKQLIEVRHERSQLLADSADVGR